MISDIDNTKQPLLDHLIDLTLLNALLKERGKPAVTS